MIKVKLPPIDPHSTYIDTGTPLVTQTGSFVTSESVTFEKTGGFGNMVTIVHDIAVSQYTGPLKDLLVSYTSSEGSYVSLWLECNGGNWYLCNSMNTNSRIPIHNKILNFNEKGLGRYRTDLAITMSSAA